MADPSLFDRVKSALTPAPAAPAPAPAPKPNYDANQVAGQGAVGQAQASRTSNIDAALAASGDRKYADGGMVGMSTMNAEPMMQGRHNPDNRLPKRAHHKGRGHG